MAYQNDRLIAGWILRKLHVPKKQTEFLTRITFDSSMVFLIEWHFRFRFLSVFVPYDRSGRNIEELNYSLVLDLHVTASRVIFVNSTQVTHDKPNEIVNTWFLAMRSITGQFSSLRFLADASHSRSIHRVASWGAGCHSRFLQLTRSHLGEEEVRPVLEFWKSWFNRWIKWAFRLQINLSLCIEALRWS